MTLLRVLKKMQRSGRPGKRKVNSLAARSDQALTRDCAELYIGIGEYSSSPVASVSKLAALNRRFFYVVRVQRVPAEEENDAALEGNVSCNVERSLKSGSSLIEVEDQMSQSRSINVRFHFVIQRALLVAEVDSCFEKVSDGEKVAHVKVVRMMERIYVFSDNLFLVE